MKRIFTILGAVLIAAYVFAQAPQKMSYQAVIRNSSNKLFVSAPVGMRISIVQGTANGTAVYVETQVPTTNANGLASMEIGSGTIVSGAFSAIDWSTGPYFIHTETDPAGGTDYSISWTSQLLSVPYALYAGNGVPIHYIGETYGGGIVFYVYDGGRHGLIAATTDQSTGINWGTNTMTNAIRDSIDGGQSNTERIIINQGPGWYAALYCANYKGGGFGDWYMPSKYELKLLFLHKVEVGMNNAFLYWSSTEGDGFDIEAYCQDFNTGNQFLAWKSDSYHVRAIRAF